MEIGLVTQPPVTYISVGKTVAINLDMERALPIRYDNASALLYMITAIGRPDINRTNGDMVPCC